MNSVDERIARFQKMAEADPNNELGHFSLGKVLLEGERFEDAIASFQRTLEINANMSKAYQHLAEAQLGAGQREAAIETLKRGHDLAQGRGDLMPARAMAVMLGELGIEVVTAEAPRRDAASTGASGGAGEGGFRCIRCGNTEPMADPPMKGALGQQIHASICGNCWREWIHMGTKVINELRLDFRDPSAQEAYETHMKEFLGLSGL